MKLKSAKYFFLVFAVIGIVFIGISSFNAYQYFFNDEFVEAESGGRVLYVGDKPNPVIVYTNNLTHEQLLVNLKYNSSSFSDGDILVIKYNVNDPNKILVFETTLILIIVFLAIGISFLGWSILIFVLYFLKDKRNNYLKENGRRTHALVTDVITINSISGLNGHPHRIICKTRDGKVIKSNMYYGEPSSYKPKHIVHVYVMPNSNKYYVDPKSFHSEEDDINYIEY